MNWKASYFGFSNLLLTGVCLAGAMGILLVRGAERPAETSASILCLEYLGDSDKPVFPIVLAVSKPAFGELQRVLTNRTDRDFATVILLPRPDMDRLVKDFRAWLSEQGRPKNAATTSMLRVTLAFLEHPAAEGRSPAVNRQTVHPFDRQAAVEFLRKLDTFQPGDAATATELKEALRVFKLRTQLNLQPQST